MATRQPKGPVVELLRITGAAVGTQTGAWYGPYPVMGALFNLLLDPNLGAGDTIDVYIQRTINPADATRTRDLLKFAQVTGAFPQIQIDYNAAELGARMAANVGNRHRFNAPLAAIPTGVAASNLSQAGGAPAAVDDMVIYGYIRAQAVVAGLTADMDATVHMITASISPVVTAA